MSNLQNLVIFIVLLSRTKVLSFNIESRDPIVKRAPEKGTYFGFSVAQHATVENSRNPSDFWILVGAPLGQNLQPETNHSGALFKCPVTDNQTDCTQIKTDGMRIHEFDYDDTVTDESSDLLSPGTDEIKDGQWLGVTVKSQKPGGKVVVCAHRYIYSPPHLRNHLGMGLCYVLNKDLETEDNLEPCKGRPVEKLHQQFGYCQVGTSLALLNEGYALMGSPGPHTWRGTVFAKSVFGKTAFLEADLTLYRGPLNDLATPIDKYSYLGMSVTGGHFFSLKELTFVSGAPRSQLVGQVFFFKKNESEEELGISLIINGFQFASSFGYEILATDINKDGYDELLVAAPFYYDDEAGGAVYIYKDLKNCTNSDCKPIHTLYGKPESRFGFAMTSLGDINKDGYNDVAIGAPYEDDTGAIYIYLGTKDGLSDKPSQIITHPKRNNIKTFGYSLSGGLDMDLNEYPDLLVGAYESDLVILYKTRPIVDITITIKGKELRNINATKKGCSQDLFSNKTCFSFQSCFVISKFRSSGTFEVKYELKELPVRLSRVNFNASEVQYIKIRDTSREYCQPSTAYLDSGKGDIMTPIKFEVRYTLRNEDINSPILNKTSVKEFEATFQKDCGEDDICNSNLVLKAGTLLNRTEDGFILDLYEHKELLLTVDVENKGESAYEANLYIIHPEVLSFIILQVDKNKTNNVICTTYNATIVTCNLGNPFHGNQTANLRIRFEIKDTDQQKLDFNVFVNSTSIEMSRQTSENFTVVLQKIIRYKIEGQSLTTDFFYSGEVKGESAMRYLQDIGPKVYHTYTISNRGQWLIRGIRVLIHWPYQVFSNREEGGKWLLYLEEQPTIDNFPKNYCQLSNLTAINPLNLRSSGVEEESSKNLKSSKNLTKSQTDNKVRRKRDIEEIVAAKFIINEGKSQKVVTMGCQEETAKCVIINCTIPLLNKNNQVKIEIHSRIWNSTLLEDYNNVDRVSIKSWGEVIIDQKSVNTTEDTVTSTMVETKGWPKHVIEQSLNIWIIVGAVIAGLLVLIILILILYKVGFFKRNRIKDHTLSGNLKKQGENETLLKDSEGKTSAQSAS